MLVDCYSPLALTMSQSPNSDFDMEGPFACRTLLDFEVPSDTPWRRRGGLDIKPVGNMIADIVRFRDNWRRHKDKMAKDHSFQNLYNKCRGEMTVSFITHTNREEDIGTKEEKETFEVIKYVSQGKEKPHLEKTKEVLETEAQYKALSWLRTMAEEEKENNPDYDILGLMEVSILKKLHKILMKDLIDPNDMTPAGCFSVRERHTTYKGQTHHYPQKNSEEEWFKEIGTLLDRYNALVQNVKYTDNKEERLLQLFKCASYLLFSLVSLHPFSDGNGRLCRLLASYTLGILTPFASPIYNIYSPTVKDDYVGAIVKARKSEPKHPADLTTLIIESNWHAWKHFLDLMQMSDIYK